MGDRGYHDLHEHLEALEAAGLLIRVARDINKDTELHPLVRWQFRGGIAEPERKAFLFESVVDAKTSYDIPVAVGVLAANREIYRIGLGCENLSDLGKVWANAMANPIDPVVVENPVCREIVITGDDLDIPGNGLDGLPVPISTPGFDAGPFLTTGHFITKDPETGIQNVGNYRGQIKGPRLVGMNPSLELRPGIYTHWLKHKALGTPLPCAIVVGCPPVVTFAAVQKAPESIDELALAGGLAGVPLNVTPALTVDLMIPAESEIVIEGFIRTDVLEPEGPVGESHGYVNLQEYNAIMEVTAITRRSNAVFTSIISQVTPSESSMIKRVAYEPMFLEHLHSIGLNNVLHVGLHEPLTNLRKVIILQHKKKSPRTEIWRALYAAVAFQPAMGKFVIAVDEDINADNADAILWALSYRMRPQEDMQMLDHKSPGHGPRMPGEDAAVLFDATLKSDFPPVSLPKREYMERAKEIWEELDLPKLTPSEPWFGYELGDWPKALDYEANNAAAGDYFDKHSADRRSDVSMNDEVEHLE